MLDRNTQNTLAGELMAKHAFVDKDGVALTGNLNIFRAEVARQVAIFREKVNAAAADAAGVGDAKAVSAIVAAVVADAKVPVMESIGNYNNESRLLMLEHYESIPAKEAMGLYIKNQCVEGLDFAQDKNMGWCFKEVKTVTLSAYDVVKTICKTELNGIVDACCIFVDNVAKNEFGNGTEISRNGLHQSYKDMRKRKGWEPSKDGKVSDAALAKQLTEICNMITFGKAPTMKRADVQFIKFFVIRAKSQANKAGKFTVRNDATIVDAIFRAIYTRKNDLAYEWSNELYDVKVAAKTSVKDNKDMGEHIAPENDHTNGGPVTLGTPEA